MNNKPSIAIDLGGTKIKTGLVQNGEVLSSFSIDSNNEKGLRAKLPELEEGIKKLLQQHGLTTADVAGLGMATPGVVDCVEKRILSIDKKFGDAPGIDLVSWCNDALHLKLTLENDARSALVGEWQFGAAKGYDNVVLMTLGTGVGSSAVMEGKLLRGKHFLGGILGGHTVINYKGSLCNCGNIGCVETEASTWCIEKKVRAHADFAKSSLSKEAVIDYATIFRCATEADALALEMRNDSMDVWSAAAINLIHAYDPEILVLSGGIMASGGQIIPHLQNKINKHAWTPWGKVKIEAAAFINSAALLGVAHLVSNE
ncbi:MAG TPA: ROK family protein [Panacibacter sp.]|nr:ROK family protein [Panacibacter sp.]HNP45351.1 ROK family protein [Panacibacter sp.]